MSSVAFRRLERSDRNSLNNFGQSISPCNTPKYYLLEHLSYLAVAWALLVKHTHDDFKHLNTYLFFIKFVIKGIPVDVIKGFSEVHKT